MSDRIEAGTEAAEPWDPIESRLVKMSILAGIAAMIVLAALINMFLLSQH